MGEQTAAIEAPPLELRHCTVEEHCAALRAAGDLPFWFHIGRSRLFGNFSRPFRDRCGNWWFQPRFGLAWPVDCYHPIERGRARPALFGSALAYQHVVPDESQANCRMVINTIEDVSAYGAASVPQRRRNTIRKALRLCRLEVLREYDAETFEQCRAAWNDLTQRTGWRGTLEREPFEHNWRRMIELPGVSLVVGREGESGRVAGFLIVQVLGDTAYVDTIASRTDLMKVHVNEALVYAFVTNAARIAGVRRAHYSLRSYVEPLERFKQGVGFVPTVFPAYTRFRGPTGWLLRTFQARSYRRMMGRFDLPDESPPAAAGE